jgi:acyl carrier protein
MPGEYDDNKEIIRSIISRITNLPQSQINDDAQLGRELPADSLTMLEIAMALEQRFKIMIPDADYPELLSLDAIAKRVSELQQKRDVAVA